VGCRSPFDRFWEGRQKEAMEKYLREDPEMQLQQQKFDKEMQKLIRGAN